MLSRLELLRKIVPHTKRANTASFLEDVISYVTQLKARVEELEAALEAKKAGTQQGAEQQAPALQPQPTPAPAAGTAGAAVGEEAPADAGGWVQLLLSPRLLTHACCLVGKWLILYARSLVAPFTDDKSRCTTESRED